MARSTQIRDLFGSYLPHALSLNKSMVRADSASFSESAVHKSIALDSTGATLPATTAEHDIQQAVRPWFGKNGINVGGIGAHPDFAYLKGTDQTEEHHITTLFMDIVNSTRLALLYPLADVRTIKNAILRAATDTVRAFDGHVHRYMGDALMAFFGGKGVAPEDSAMAAINCAAVLRVIMRESVVPQLRAAGVDPGDLGFRVGIDFGKDPEVQWSSYGYAQLNEVTATSFFVDLAAKLQHRAGRNGIMLGTNLLDFIDLPDTYREIKKQVRGGEEVMLPVLIPNLTRADGNPINYNIRRLRDPFESLLPIPTELKQVMGITGVRHHSGISYKLYVNGAGGQKTPYQSVSRCLDKHLSLQFEVQITQRNFNYEYPLKASFRKTNHGAEADKAGEAKSYRPTEYIVSRPSAPGYGGCVAPIHVVKHDERTLYRGIHEMEARVTDTTGKLLFCDTIGVHIR